MKNRIAVAVAVVILIGIIAAYFYSQQKPQQQQQQEQPRQVQVQPISPPPPPEPAIEQTTETGEAQPPLPELSGSDGFTQDAIANLVGDRSLKNLFYAERIIRRIVATVDNLPRSRVPLKVSPVAPASGMFLTEGSEDSKTISPKNAARYAAYVKVAEAIDAQKLVEVYIRLYPLFQQAYEELGYPKKYFNDRLLEAIENMLAAPSPREPIRLVQPHVLYQFADPGLEARSAGQKILMRMGSGNEAKIKTKLREIKEQLTLHMRGRRLVASP